jgi:hypothetical protein
VEVNRGFRGAYCLHYRSRRPDDGGSKHVWNIGLLLAGCITQYLRRLSSSYSPLWEHEISKRAMCTKLYWKEVFQVNTWQWSYSNSYEIWNLEEITLILIITFKHISGRQTSLVFSFELSILTKVFHGFSQLLKSKIQMVFLNRLQRTSFKSLHY